MTSLSINEILTSSQNQKCVTMSSREISQLTGKLHKNVLRDIRRMISDLTEAEDLSSDLSFNTEVVKSGRRGRPEQVYHLNRQLTLCLTTGYSNVQRFRVIQRMDDLEQQVNGQPFQKLHDLSVKMKVSEELGKIGSGLMNKRKTEKQKLKQEEKQVLLTIQLQLDLGK